MLFRSSKLFVFKVSLGVSGMIGTVGVPQNDAFPSPIDDVLQKFFQVRSVDTFYIGCDAGVFEFFAFKSFFLIYIK